MDRPRVLLAVTVFNGEPAVMRCLESVKRLDRAECDIDTVVLDDNSTDPGFSDRLQQRAHALGFRCYSSPRNLGISRNANLGLLLAMEESYDYVLISNSDVVYPASAVTTMVECARANDRVGSVTAWSNNVSIYSLPNADPASHLDEYVVDWAAVTLRREFGTEVIDIPAGVSFSMLMPVDVVSTVGLMDPVFGRGYCEGLDWSLRSKAAGYRSLLAPSTFVYHQGAASTEPPGVVDSGHATTSANEAVIEMRHPSYRGDVAAFVASGVMPATSERAARALVQRAGHDNGYVVDVLQLDRPSADPRLVHCKIVQDDRGLTRITAMYRGFAMSTDAVAHLDAVTELRRLFDCDPERVRFFDRSPLTTALSNGFGTGTIIENAIMYPERV